MIPVFDSNIVIDFLEGSRDAQAELEAYPTRMISIISYIEAMVGVRQLHRQILVRQVLEAQFIIEPLSSAIIEAAIQIRREHGLKLPDAVIWATARVHESVLITRNSKDFSPKDPSIRIPYRLKR